MDALTKAATAKVETASLDDLDIPLGKYRQTENYDSFQNHFPALYGISEAGLSSTASLKRQAQAYQLKGYLLFFDQIMANYFAQLSHVKDLFSTDSSLQRTYFYQVVDSFTNYEKIYRTTDLAKIRDMVDEGDREDMLSHRNRFLDHLVARFAEQFNDYAQIMYSVFGSNQKEMIVDKCNFLNDYPVISSERSLAYNYSLTRESDLWDSRNVSGLEKRLAKLLGIPNDKRRNLGGLDDGEGMYLIENILLRPEEKTDPSDPFLPICADPKCIDCPGKDPYSYRIQIILRGDNRRFSRIDFRRWAEGVIRSETPAHILPKICWINTKDMVKLEALYRAWIYLKAGRTTEDRNQTLNAFIAQLFAVKSIYPSQKLRGCDNEEKFLSLIHI